MLLNILQISVCLAFMGLSAYLIYVVRSSRGKLKKVQEDLQRYQNEYATVVRERDAAVNSQKAAAASYEQKLDAMTKKFDRDNAHLLSQAFVPQSMADLQETIKLTIDREANRICQEFLGSVSEEAEGLSRDVQFELLEKVWDAFQNFKQANVESPLLMPDNVKIAYTKGSRTVLVIEEKPQVRSVSFDGNLVATNAVARHAQSSTANGYRYTLSFPYVYFVVVFDNNKYAYHELYFRNKPLTSVREHIHLAPIPNVWRDKGNNYKPMCMGEGFQMSVNEELTIARQVELIISDFWQRTFNAHLGNGSPEKVDSRIKNYAVWQQNTEADPLFILTVSWPKGKTIKGVVETILHSRPQKHALDPVDRNIRALLEAGVAKITNKIKAEIKKAKSSNKDIGKIDETARRILEEQLLEHSKKVFSQITT